MPEDMKAGELLPLVTEVVAAKVGPHGAACGKQSVRTEMLRN